MKWPRADSLQRSGTQSGKRTGGSGIGGAREEGHGYPGEGRPDVGTVLKSWEGDRPLVGGRGFSLFREALAQALRWDRKGPMRLLGRK